MDNYTGNKFDQNSITDFTFQCTGYVFTLMA